MRLWPAPAHWRPLTRQEARRSPRWSASPAISTAPRSSSCRRCRRAPGTSPATRCASLLLTLRHERGDPLNHPRVTLGGDDRRMPGAGRPRPGIYSEDPQGHGLYAGFADFASAPRLRIEDVHFNGGFGRAAPLSRRPRFSSRGRARSGADRGQKAEAPCRKQTRIGPAALAAELAGHKATRPVWRAVGLDAEEAWILAAGGHAARAQFAAPGHDPGAWRARLEALLGRAKL